MSANMSFVRVFQVLDECHSELLCMFFFQVLEECQSELLCVFVRYWRSASLSSVCSWGSGGAPIIKVLNCIYWYSVSGGVSELLRVFVRYWRSASRNYCVCLSGTGGVPVWTTACVCQLLEECQSELLCVFVRYWRSASLNYCVCLSGTGGVPVWTTVCVCQVLEECQSELYDLKFKQEGKQSAISDEVEILLTGMYLPDNGTYIRYLQNT